MKKVCSNRLSAKSSRRRKWRGKRRELELVKLLTNHSWNSKRSAMSGPGRLDPDVTAVKRHRLAVFEVKSSQKKWTKVNRRQVDGLRQALQFYAPLCPNIKSAAVVAIKFPFKKWIFIKLKPEDLDKNARVIEEKLTQLKSREINEYDFRRRRASIFQEAFITIKPSTRSNWRP